MEGLVDIIIMLPLMLIALFAPFCKEKPITEEEKKEYIDAHKVLQDILDAFFADIMLGGFNISHGDPIRPFDKNITSIGFRKENYFYSVYFSDNFKMFRYMGKMNGEVLDPFCIGIRNGKYLIGDAQLKKSDEKYIDNFLDILQKKAMALSLVLI